MSGESEETLVLESTRKVLGTIEKLNNLDIIQQTEHEFLAKATEMEEQLLKNRIRKEEILEVIIRDRKIENMLEQEYQELRKSLTPGQICLSVEKIYLTIDENLKKVFTVGNPFSLYYWFIR